MGIEQALTADFMFMWFEQKNLGHAFINVSPDNML
jgi:hypothetical protein